jgi:uncharacterized protein DUF6680
MSTTGMTISDGLIIAATILGPILAVQAQKFIERAGERRRQKLRIFYTLMSYRATPLASERIQALNTIDLEFRPNRLGYQSAKAKAVTTAWKILLDELNTKVDENDKNAIAAWTRRCDDYSVDLLFAFSAAMGFKFNKVELKRGIYYPRGHHEMEASQRAILANLEKLLAGERSLPMNVTGFPVSEEALKLQMEVQQKLLKALTGEGEMHVQMKQSKK